jgi:SAM-dependent methyltransferase
VVTGPSSEFDRYVHPDEDRMAAWRRVYERYLIVEDVYPSLAQRIIDHGARRFADLGGGRGPIAAVTADAGVETVVIDLDEQMLAETHRPSVCGDLTALPLATGSLDAAAAVNCLYFLTDPRVGIREAHRVLRRGGVFVASAPSRWNDPELEGIDPRWGRPSPFDSEDAPELVGGVFGDVEVQRWEVVAYRLPDEQAIADYLHGFNVPDWETRVDAIKPPLNITKRGAHVWAQR